MVDQLEFVENYQVRVGKKKRKETTKKIKKEKRSVTDKPWHACPEGLRWIVEVGPIKR